MVIFLSSLAIVFSFLLLFYFFSPACFTHFQLFFFSFLRFLGFSFEVRKKVKFRRVCKLCDDTEHLYGRRSQNCVYQERGEEEKV